MDRASVAWFVSPHGFGHASRAAACIEALGRRAGVAVDVVTSVPEWFFAQSLGVAWRWIEAATDVGLVQASAVEEDVGATVERLEAFWRRLPTAAAELAGRWEGAAPELVVSDISPLGLAVGERLGVPTVLVENFTWDWIYEAYADLEPRLAEFGARYADLAGRATLRIQCEPVCRRVPDAVLVPPVARRASAGREETRRALGLDDGDERPIVLLTMGGFGWGEAMPAGPDEWLLVTLGGMPRLERRRGVVRLPDRSPVYPPDLVAAADVVVAKLGYSTVAECRQGGARLAFLGRERFPEAAVLADWVRRRLVAEELEAADLAGARWREVVAALLARPRRRPVDVGGAAAIAERLAAMLAHRV